jgi:hypothetical protein
MAFGSPLCAFVKREDREVDGGEAGRGEGGEAGRGEGEEAGRGEGDDVAVVISSSKGEGASAGRGEGEISSGGLAPSVVVSSDDAVGTMGRRSDDSSVFGNAVVSEFPAGES